MQIKYTPKNVVFKISEMELYHLSQQDILQQTIRMEETDFTIEIMVTDTPHMYTHWHPHPTHIKNTLYVNKTHVETLIKTGKNRHGIHIKTDTTQIILQVDTKTDTRTYTQQKSV